MITYPLVVPSMTEIRSLTLRRRVVAAASQSPFTFARQVYLWPGDRWEAEVSLVPMKRARFDAWNAFLLSLDGPVGTFLMGDPQAPLPRGSAATNAGAPLVNGGAQVGEDLVVDGLPAGAVNYLRAGDKVQINGRLHMITTDVSANGSGMATFNLRPRLRTPPPDNAPLTVANPVGVWSLVAAEHHWTVDATGLANLTFAVVEPL